MGLLSTIGGASARAYGFTRSAVAAAKDAYFNLTTLLLPGNGTNGAQNNTFLDSSTNNFTITRNGNATQGTFTPFSQTGWGVSNTITQYCQLNNADFALGTGDFTVELWMYCTDDSSYSATNFCSAPSNPNFTFGFGSGTAGARQLYLEYGGGATTGIGSAMSNYINKWVHIAVVRQSGTVTAYQNGVSLGSVSKSAAVGSTANLYLLRNSGDTNQDFRGFISNFRMCKSAVYTSNFTPSTTPLTTTSQGATSCVLLTFQDNRFKDNSATAATVTPTSTAIQAFSPFAPTAAYDSNVVGGSGYFDGSGDYLTAANNAAFAFGTGDFTIELWVYPTYIGTFNNMFHTGDNGTGQANFRLNAGKPEFFANDSAAFILTGATTLKINTWSHIAFSRTGSTNRIFVNGVQDATATNAYSYSGSGSIQIGAWSANAGTNQYAGYMSGLRVLKGTALYTSTFTPPTAPLTAITNTSFLLNFINASITDATAKNEFETVGSVQISTAQSKFGGSSIYFNGTASQRLLPVQNYPHLIFGTGDFTIEGWIYVVGQGATTISGIWDQRPGVNGTYINWVVDFGGYGGSAGAPSLVLYTNSAVLYRSGTITTGAWNHIALCRASGTTRMFINGTLSGTATADTNNYLSGGSVANYRPCIGCTDGGDSLNGYLNGFRASRYARYTSNFTAPTSPFPLQ